MKTTLIVAAFAALAFTTGFTCSKNTPEPEVQEEVVAPPMEQEEMGAPMPTEGTETMPAPTEEVPATEGTGN